MYSGPLPLLNNCPNPPPREGGSHLSQVRRGTHYGPEWAMGAQQARGALKHGGVGQSPIATQRVSARRDGVARRGSRDKQEKEAIYMDGQPDPESNR